MGEVYAAYDPSSNRKLAISFCDSSWWDWRPRHRRGANASRSAVIAKLSTQLVTVYEIGVHGDRLFIAMEYWMAQRLRVAPCDAAIGGRDRACVPGRGEGLAAAHAAGVIHRDFNPTT